MDRDIFQKKVLIKLMIPGCIFLFFLTGFDYSYGLLLVEQGWGMTRFTYGGMEPNVTARVMAQSLPIILFILLQGKFQTNT